ncbi:MAG: aminopeptidase P family protein [Bacteroidetes bacterium]|nr:MAG: aminopeptidase P family protein [Bacteroidota bacterium]
MQYLFEASVYTDRRKTLAQSVGSDVILIAGNNNSPINYQDNYYPFRQDSNFVYYAGLNMPGLNLVIDCVSGESTLFGDEATMEHVVWMGPQPSLKELADRVGISNVRPASELLTKCDGRAVHCLPPYRTEHFTLLQKVTEHGDCSVKPSEILIKSVISQREIKEAREIEQMEEALGITAQMHIHAMKSAKPGMTEANIAGIAQGIALANQCQLAYGMILTKDGHILHNHDHHHVIKEGDMILGDFGCENRMLYAADITRTFPVSKTFTEKQKHIYEIVLEAEIKGINACRPGQAYKDVHQLAARIIADGLISLGLMTGNADEAVAAGAHALFFPHGLGHMIGLDVHDMEGLGEDMVGYDESVTRSDQFGTAYLRLGKTLRPGHVLTVEPGIYFIPALIDMWQKEGKHTEFINYDKVNAYRDFGGIRIEENVLVTETDQRVLGPSIPKTVDQVEALRG